MTGSKIQLNHALARVAASITLLLGGVVLFGWHARLPVIIQIHPDFVPMQYNTALGFLLAGFGLLVASQWRRLLTRVAGGLVGLIGITALIEHLSGAKLGVDQLFMEHYITVGTSHPGRMAPNTALCFTLVGITLLMTSLERRGTGYRGTIVLIAALIVGLSTTALIGYMVGVQPAYGWGNLTRMAAHTALGFTILGGGLIALLWEKAGREWLAWIVGLLSITVSIALWQALAVSSEGPANDLMLVFGLGMSLALIQTIRDAQRARELNRDFVALLENTTDFIYFKDKASRFRFCSQTLANITGHASWRDMVGKHDLDVFPAETAQIYYEEEFPIFREGVPLLHKIDPYYDESGNKRWVSTSKWPMLDQTGEVTGLFGISRDITDRKQADEALVQERQYLEALLDNISEAVVSCDGQGILTRFNEAARTLHGLPEQPIAPEQWADHYDLYQEDGKTPLRKDDIPLFRALQGERVRDAEMVVAPKHGTTRTLIANGQPMRATDGKLLGAVVAMHDITERKRAEAELLRSNSELEQFSYAISHDMRQPLRMISSYMQLLEKGLADHLDVEKHEFFGFAIDGAKRMDAMMLGLLEYSRVGRKGEPPAWLESRAVLENALMFLQPAIADAQADVRIQGEWPRIHVSPDEMLRLVQNLIGNALKFRLTGRKPEITVTSEIVGSEWRMSVADNGVGILPDQIGRLFQVFQRLQSRADYEGTGIGLALCRKIAQHHGGRIWAESEGEGKGSKFCVVLPQPSVEL